MSDRRMLTNIRLTGLKYHQSKHVMYAWLIAEPSELRTPGEFYAVKIIAEPNDSVGDYHQKVLQAIDLMNSYLIGPPPEIVDSIY